jgi:MscS family membrane protein
VQSIITPPARSLPRFRPTIIAAVALAALAVGQPPIVPTPQPAIRAPQPDAAFAGKLRTPRATLQTLYYAVDVYDYFPALIADAVACLDLGGAMASDDAAAALLAVQLETVLKTLDIPLASVPDVPTAEPVQFELPGEPKSAKSTITLRRSADGLWRFDRPTVEAIPILHRAAVARQKDLQAERAALREGYTDARATIRRFRVNAFRGDFAAAAQALDLSNLTAAQRRERGPALAQMLAFVLQRRGYAFTQLFPDNPSAPPFTWHADSDGRIVLERVHPAEGKDAWLFSRQTVNNLEKMYAAAQPAVCDARYVRLNLVVPPLRADGKSVAVTERPATVPARFGSPRDLLRTFFQAMDSAETSDARLAEALDCLDLGAIPDADRKALGATLANKLDAVLRALHLDLTAVPDAWDAPPQLLGDDRLKVQLVRQKDGSWRVSESTVAALPGLFEKLAPKERAGRERSGQFESARDTTVTFMTAIHQSDFDLAAKCLDLSEFVAGAQADVGPVLAYKLKYILDRTGRIYIQEVPDDPDGPRYSLYRGELGRIVLARRTEDPHKGQWLITTDTVKRIEPMFRAVAGRQIDASVRELDEEVPEPSLWDVPGVWLRVHMPPLLRRPLGPLAAYQWMGLVVAVLVSGAAARHLLGRMNGLVGWLLRKSGSCLGRRFIARKLRPLTWLAGLWLFFLALGCLDLPVALLDGVLAVKRFLLAGLIAWFGCRFIDLAMAVYTDSELLKPHRSLGDMIVPVTVRVAKAVVVLVVMTYLVYLVGQGDLLGRFLTGLGVAGLAASLAAQDALKSFYGTLLLIGERSFKLGDSIAVNGQEGTVETVGFRATRLRTVEGSLLTIPNSTIATASINNLGAKGPPQSKAA